MRPSISLTAAPYPVSRQLSFFGCLRSDFTLSTGAITSLNGSRLSGIGDG